MTCIPGDVFVQRTASLEAEIAALKAGLKEMRQRTSIEIDYLTTLVKDLQRKAGTIQASSAGRKGSEKPKRAAHTSSSATTPSIPPPTPASPSPSLPELNSPAATGACGDKSTEISTDKDKDNNVADLPTQSTDNDMDNNVANLPTQNTDNESPLPDPSDNAIQPPTNNDTEHDIDSWPHLPKIAAKTATLLIGDSVLRGLHQTKMSVSTEPAQVLSVSGLDIKTLTECIKCTDTQPRITTVVTHVGINDSKQGHVIGKGAWKQLINAIHRCFPKATIFLSSILPFNAAHAHNTHCINTSNNNMQEVCQSTRARFIDNDASFFSHSGRVKSFLFVDKLHPNKVGSSTLARTIKRSYSHEHTPSIHATQQNQHKQSHFSTTLRSFHRSSDLPGKSTRPTPPPMDSHTHFPCLQRQHDQRHPAPRNSRMDGFPPQSTQPQCSEPNSPIRHYPPVTGFQPLPPSHQPSNRTPISYHSVPYPLPVPEHSNKPVPAALSANEKALVLSLLQRMLSV